MTPHTVVIDPPKKPAGRMSPSVLVNAIRHYPLVFAGLLVLAAAAGVGVWLFLPPPKQTAMAVYRIATQAPRLTAATADPQADLNSYRQSQMNLVRTRQVLNAALNQLSVSGDAAWLREQPDPIAWLDKNLQVDFRPGNEFMRVYLEGDDPNELLVVLKAVAAAYQKELDDREKGEQKRRVKDVEDTYKAYQDEIATNNKRIDAIAETLKSTNDATLLMQEALDQEAQRAVHAALKDAQTRLEVARAALPLPGAAAVVPVVPAAAVAEAVAKDEAVLAAEGKVQTAKDGVKGMEARVQPGAPALVQAQAALKTAEAARDKTRADARERVENRIKEQMVNDGAVAAAKKQEVYEQAVQQRAALEKQRDEIRDAINKRGTYRRELEKLREDIGSRKKMLDELALEREKLRVEERSPSRVTLHEAPFAQAGIEGFRRARTTLAAAVGLFAVGFAGLTWWEHRGRRVTRSGELAESLGLPLLGTLPPWAADQATGHGELVEAIDSTRTVLLHGHTVDRPLRTLVVTSALPGEGKTSLSGHLAVSLARAGYRTLLVDGDVREPSAHKVFDLPAGPGLCEVLREEVAPADAISPTKVPGLAVMPAGRWSLTARQALVGDRWGLVRRQLERQYDFVVLDSAPLLLATDSLLLARGADGVVLSVLKGVSRVGSVAHTQERLSSLGARVLGVVVSGARPEYPGAYPHTKYVTDRPGHDLDAVPLTPA